MLFSVPSLFLHVLCPASLLVFSLLSRYKYITGVLYDPAEGVIGAGSIRLRPRYEPVQIQVRRVLHQGRHLMGGSKVMPGEGVLRTKN